MGSGRVMRLTMSTCMWVAGWHRTCVGGSDIGKHDAARERDVATGVGPGAAGLPGQDWTVIEGFVVFTSDEEEIGTVESVFVSPRNASQYYVKVNATALSELTGTDTLYVPDEDILTIATDRLILNTTADALNRPDWVTPPDELAEPE